MNISLELIGRSEELFDEDVIKYEPELKQNVSQSSFLVIGAAGSIGQAVTKEIFKRNPKKLHVVDISENNMVELVRDLRSSIGYIDGEFKALALDIGSTEYNAFFENDGDYDYILNLSALKHVRSEKDPYTLMRMITVNIENTEKTLIQAKAKNVKKYFCVSTDKAANPVNLMGASKKVMELFLMRRSQETVVSTARFANVAFSDGSLLHGFNQRLLKRQPITAPTDVTRYFVTPKESGELCLMSCLLGKNREIFFPKPSKKLQLISFSDIAKRYLKERGYKAIECQSEEEARAAANKLPEAGEWPCYFFESDTTGEKPFEEFFTENENLDMKRFNNIGVIRNEAIFNDSDLNFFTNTIKEFKKRGQWEKKEIVDIFNKVLPNLNHEEKGKYLDSRM